MESMNLPCGVVSHQKVGNFSSAIFPVSSKYIIFPPSTELRARRSGCHAKIPLASFASIRRSISLNTGRPGALAVCFSTKISTTSICSLTANSLSSASWSEMLLTCRSSVSVDFLVYIKNFLVWLFILLHWLTRSHALRGEPFLIQDFLGGIQNRRHFVPTIFLVQKPFSKNCGIHCTKFEPFLKAIPTRKSETMRTKFCGNNFLGKGFRKTSADSFFLNSDVASGGGGVWGGILRLLLFLFWRNSGGLINSKSVSPYNLNKIEWRVLNLFMCLTHPPLPAPIPPAFW